MKKKILILGGSSLLSVNLFFFLKNQFNIYLACKSKKPIIKNSNIFFTSFKKEKLKLLLGKIKPDIVIISSANTNIENCEKYKKKTYSINFELIKFVTQFSKKFNFKIIFFSTDQVYKSSKIPSTEKSKLEPVNYYSKTKVLAENYLRNNIKKYLILRTNFFGYGPYYRKSFSDLILFNNQKKIIINYFVDNYFSPIYLPNLSKVLIKLIKKDITGTYNISSSNYLSKYEFAVFLIKKFKLDLKYINKGYLENNKFLVKRPLNMSLSNKKIQNKVNIKIPSIQKQILQMKKDHSSGYFLFMKNLKIIKK